MAEGVGRRAHLGGLERRDARPHQGVRARDAALPVGRAAHRAPQELLTGRRRRTLLAPVGPSRAPSDGLRRLRPARGEPRDQERTAPARGHRGGDRPVPGQFRRWGISIDWTREFGTHEPRYYRWTQWLFLRLFERGLAYRKEAAVNWCPKDATVLANEQVIDGRCERCGTVVEVRQLEQWFFRITEYADRLLDDLETVEWPPHVVAMQEHWIGRSEGAEVVFRCEELGIDTRCSPPAPTRCSGPRSSSWRPSTRRFPAQRHPGGARVRQPRAARDARGARRRAAPEDRCRARPHRVNPVTGEQIPMYVADYVLMEYGTGAVMAVPAHDQRDYDFAEQFGLEIRRSCRATGPLRRARPSWRTRRATARQLGRVRWADCARGKSARSWPGWTSAGSAGPR